MSETPGSKILGYFAMHYEGVYIPGQDYTFLSLVIYAGGLWLCIKKTGTVNVDPGSNDEVWVLSSTSAATIDKEAAQVAAGQAQESATQAAASANDANASKLAAQSAAGSAQGSASAAAESKSAAESAMAGAQEAQAAAEQTAADFQGIVNLVGAGNPNLLHNCGFRNPINQRGVSGAISTGAYFYDRWIRNSGTVTVAAGYLTMASGAVIEQRIEGNLLAGVICTVSFEVGSTIYHGSGAFPTNNGTVPVEVDGYPDITFGCATGYMFVLIPATSETSIKRLKCEMGFVSTLHLDPPMDHATEMLKCQRFFFAGVYLTVIGLTNSTTSAIVTFAAPVNMRILPSVNQSVLGLMVGSTRYNNCPFAISEMKGNTFVQATVTIPSGTWQNTSPATGEIPGTTFVSADL